MEIFKVVENPPRVANNSGVQEKLDKLLQLAEQKEAALYKRNANQKPPQPPQQHVSLWWEKL